MHTALFTQPQLDIVPIYMYTPNETLESSMSAPSNEEIYSNPRTVGLYDPSLSGPQKYQMKQNKAYLKHPQKTPVVSEEVPPDDHFYEVDDY